MGKGTKAERVGTVKGYNVCAREKGVQHGTMLGGDDRGGLIDDEEVEQVGNDATEVVDRVDDKIDDVALALDVDDERITMRRCLPKGGRGENDEVALAIDAYDELANEDDG